MTAAPRVDISAGYRRGVGIAGLTLNALVVLVVLALLGTAILFGLQRLNAISPTSSASSISATRVPTAVTPPGMTTFLGKDFSIAYPTTWAHHAADESTPYGTAHVDSFEQDASTFAGVLTLPSVPTDLLQQGIDGVGRSVLNGALPSPTAAGLRVTYNSLLWLEDDFAVTLVVNHQNVPEAMRVLGANVGVHTFVVVVIAPQASFAATNTTVFETMLASVRLG